MQFANTFADFDR